MTVSPEGCWRDAFHGVRHRSVTDIANSDIPFKVGMVLTADKAMGQFMHYVHAEDGPCARWPSWPPIGASIAGAITAAKGNE